MGDERLNNKICGIVEQFYNTFKDEKVVPKTVEIEDVTYGTDKYETYEKNIHLEKYNLDERRLEYIGVEKGQDFNYILLFGQDFRMLILYTPDDTLNSIVIFNYASIKLMKILSVDKETNEIKFIEAFAENKKREQMKTFQLNISEDELYFCALYESPDIDEEDNSREIEAIFYEDIPRDELLNMSTKEMGKYIRQYGNWY